MLRPILAAVAVALSASAYAADAPPAAAATTGIFADKIVATGRGFEIKQSQVNDAFVQIKASMAAQGQDVPETRRPELEGQIIERLVATKVLLLRATADDRAKAKIAGDKFIADAKKQAPSEDAFNRQLVASGLTMAQFQTQINERAVCEEVLNREKKSKIVITAEQVKKFYDENPSQFEKPEMVRASHILIGTKDAAGQDMNDGQKKEKKAQAEKILARAKKGEDFAALAKEFSDDPGSKDTGGEYTFPRGQMMPEFEAAAFSLKTNQVSDLVTTVYGYHIIKLSEKIPAQKVEFTKVEKDIKEYLERKEVEKQLPDYIAEIKREAGVVIVGPEGAAFPPAAPAKGK